MNMNVSYSWLKQLVDFSLDADQLAKSLVGAGLEVASVSKRCVPERIVVARVLTAERHPNADKLSLCTVDAGTGETLQIVCGAPNVRAGLKVACALEGAVLGPDFTIKKARIRGVESRGMLCSQRELGLSDEHAGIMELAESWRVGAPLREYFPDDAVIEVEVTPNRGDCLSMRGIAREVAARAGTRIKPMSRPATDNGGNVADHITVRIDDPVACPRYMGRLVRGVKIAPSPDWLRDRLSSAGMRPINNVVDITNYALLLYGQPMHAFDYSRIGGRTIVVRHAAEGSKFVTLDGIERPLVATDLLICDADKPVALAGIMGGQNSEIADTTTDVFLECAYFNPAGIRVTSKRLGLQTESSFRFERGVDPCEGVEEALETATALLQELCGGTVVAGKIDSYPTRIEAKRVTVRISRIKRVLGVDVEADTALKFLEGLGMTCVARTPDSLTVDVPPLRHDISQEVDLIEEVGRLYGYDNIPSREYASVLLDQRAQTLEVRTDALRNALAFGGFNEVLSVTMSSEKARVTLTPSTPAVNLLNPVSTDLAQMRTCLLGSLLQALIHNRNHRNLNCRLFEIGPAYTPRDSQKLPDERTRLGILIEGDYMSQSWSAGAVPASFYALKGVVEHAAEVAALGACICGPVTQSPQWFDSQAADIMLDGVAVGSMGRLGRSVLDAFDVKGTVFYAELDVHDAIRRPAPVVQYRHLQRFPAVSRDFAFVVDEALLSAVAIDEIRTVSPLVESVSVFDVYRGDKLPSGKKSLAYALVLRAPDRTLTDKEADEVGRLVIEMLRTKHGAELRS